VYTLELETFRARIPILLEVVFKDYTGFRDKNSLKPGLGVLLSSVADAIEDEELVNIDAFRYTLLGLVLRVDLSTVILSDLLSLVFEQVYQDESINSEKLRTEFNAYENLFITSLVNNTYLDYDTSLWGNEGYQYSQNRVTVSPRQIDRQSRKIYTLYRKSREWFNHSLDKNLSRLLSRSGLSYEPTVVYQGKLYTAVSGVKVNYNKFIASEWMPFQSKYLNSSSKLNKVLSDKLNSAYYKQFEVSQDVNEVTSDSKIHSTIDAVQLSEADREGLINTFGGSGKLIYSKLETLQADSEHLGGYEGSPVGSFNYMAGYVNWIKAAARCESVDEQFGDFQALFVAKSQLDKIAGLSFLDPLARTKSFNHGVTIPAGVNISQSKITYNPVYARFYRGLSINTNILFPSNINNTYKVSPDYDPLSLCLDLLLQRCCVIGDNVFAMLQSLDGLGRLPGFECLGSVEYQLLKMQRVFSTRPTVLDKGEKSGGLSGSISYFLKSYERLLSVSNTPQLPQSGTQSLEDWFNALERSIDEVRSEISTVGIRTSGIGMLPDIQFKVYNPSQRGIITSLQSLGLTESEVDNILSAESFTDLVTKFAPLTDSSDLKSFFRGYELAQLITEFSGEKGLSAFLEFLYQKSPLDSLLNILRLTLKNPSVQTYVQTSKFPKLIGLLVSLTYAVNPDQLSKFAVLLSNNQLSLLDSITALYDAGERTIIKAQDEISVLDGVVDQLIRGRYEDPKYSPDVNYNTAQPDTIESWANTLSGSLGNVKPEQMYRLFDKVSGLTPKELITVLNNPSPTSSLGQVVDGFSGGDLTKFLKYVNLSGLAIKLGFYHNSGQVNNAMVNFSDNFYTLPSLLDSLEKIANNIKVLKSVLRVKYLDIPKFDSEFDGFNQLFSVQNKQFAALSDLIQNGTVTGSYNPVEPPGIGNSRIANRAEAANSLSPEQARLIIDSGSVTSVIGTKYNYEPITDGFIKFTQKNKFLSGIRQCSTSYPDTVGEQNAVPAPSTVLPAPSKTLTSKAPITVNSGLGKNYLPDGYVPSKLSKKFNAYDSCKKFGGQNCDSLYNPSPDDMCVTDINKSFYPQTSTGNVSDGNLVKIDRALGYFSQYAPSSGSIIPSSRPAYFDVLDTDNIQIGSSSEPIVPFQTGVKPTADQGLLFEYANSKHAMAELISKSKREYTELTCDALESVYEYQTCMNMLKCKRSEVTLPFCPNTLKGGRAK